MGIGQRRSELPSGGCHASAHQHEELPEGQRLEVEQQIRHHHQAGENREEEHDHRTALPLQPQDPHHRVRPAGGDAAGQADERGYQHHILYGGMNHKQRPDKGGQHRHDLESGQPLL